MANTDPESQYGAQINVKMSAQLKQALEHLFQAHGVAPAEILRRLAQIAVDYEKETGELPLRHLYLIKGEPLSPAPTDKNAQKHAGSRTRRKGLRDTTAGKPATQKTDAAHERGQTKVGADDKF